MDPTEIELLDLYRRHDLEGKFIDVDGHRLYSINRGRGSILLLIHGYGSCVYTWRNNLKILSHDFRVIAFDLPGFGLSRAPAGFSFTLDAYVEFLKKLMDRLRIKKCSLLGHSLGGTIALAFWRRYSWLIQSLILEAVPVPGDQRVSRKALRNLLLYSFYDKKCLDDDLVRVFECLNSLLDNRLPGLEDLLATGLQRSQCNHPDPATLILWGQEDRILPMESIFSLRTFIERAEQHIFPHCGHVPHEEHPALANAAMRHFICEISGT